MKIYQIIPHSPLHFGERGIGREETAEFPHSDTIFSALISAWRLMYRTDEFYRLIRGITEPGVDPPLRISSAFPYVGEVFFLPRPAIHMESSGEDRKQGKKVKYISWRQAEDLVNSDFAPQVRSADTMISGQLWLDPEEKKQIKKFLGLENVSRFRAWSPAEGEAVARVTIDRVSAASNIFYQGVTQFSQGCGFYLLADFEDETYRKAIEDGLHFLGEQGIGGGRSVGLGQFALKDAGDQKFGVPPGDRNYYWLLSLYHPRHDEVEEQGVLDGARYTLITRRGWIYSPDEAGQRRRSVRMIAEGSLLNQPVTGNVLDLKPISGFPHPVWRSGIALTITTRRWRDA